MIHVVFLSREALSQAPSANTTNEKGGWLTGVRDEYA
jgi:hypothetical protein